MKTRTMCLLPTECRNLHNRRRWKKYKKKRETYLKSVYLKNTKFSNRLKVKLQTN